MKEVKDKSNSLNVLVYRTGFHDKGSEYSKVPYYEFRINDFLSCHPERSSMHMYVSNKFSPFV